MSTLMVHLTAVTTSGLTIATGDSRRTQSGAYRDSRLHCGILTGCDNAMIIPAKSPYSRSRWSLVTRFGSLRVELRRLILRLTPKSPRLHIGNGKEASNKRQTSSTARGRVAVSSRSLSLLALDNQNCLTVRTFRGHLLWLVCCLQRPWVCWC